MSTKTQQAAILSIQKNWHLSLDLEKFFATDNIYVCGIFWKHTKK